MVSQESHIVYKLHSHSNIWGDEGSNARASALPTYMLALKESQGYAWNQDLFASRYTQETGVVFDSDDYRISKDDESESEFEYEDNESGDVDYDEDDNSMDYGYYAMRDGVRAPTSMRRRRRSSRPYSYTGSREEGAPIEGVKVVNIILTEDEVKKDRFGS